MCVFLGYLRKLRDHKNVSIRITRRSTSTEFPDVFSAENEPTCWNAFAQKAKLLVLVLIWVACSSVLMLKNEKVEAAHQLSVPKGSTRDYYVYETLHDEEIRIEVEGAFLPEYYANLSTHWMQVWVQRLTPKKPLEEVSAHLNSNFISIRNASDTWRIPIVSEKLIGVVPEVRHRRVFRLRAPAKTPADILRVKLQTNAKANFPVSITYNTQPIRYTDGVLYAALVLCALYALIIFEIVHRTLAAMLASTMSVAILAALNARPTMAEIVSWIDIETLLLLFSMMTLVTIFGETGVFDYLSVFAYRVTGGKVWPLINTLCLFTAVMSCVLDNVTTALLMTPVTIRLCEVMKVNPSPVLIAMVIHSNLGGAVTPIGDPPNVIVSSNPAVMKAGVTFSVFTLHMGVGTILATAVAHFLFRFLYRDVKVLRYSEPTDVQDLRREIAVWKRATASVSSYTKDEEAVKESLRERTNMLLGELKEKTTGDQPESNYDHTLQDLVKQYPIRDKGLLVKSTVTLLFVVCVFFLHSIPEMSRLGIGWTALLGAILLLLLSNRDDIDTVFARVEWSTLLFFASLFILMEALARLGLIDWIGKQTQAVIMSVGPEHRLAVAVLLILWVSAFASAFVDNIPLTTMMIRVATALVDNRELDLPLQPLVWALSFGACFGGNGSLFGSSSNIVCAGVAEQHGYRFSFVQFLWIGLPVMVTTMLVITVYLMLCHVLFQWH